MMSKSADIIALQETWLMPQEISDLSAVNQNFSYYGKSAIDTNVLLSGRPYGGVALMWRNNLFETVKVIKCASNRIVSIRATVSDKTMLFFSVYMPTEEHDNLVDFVECLSEITAIVENENVDCVYVMGDYNAHPGRLFGKELLNFCVENKWICADIEKLGIDSGSYTYISDAHGSCTWLDHCITTEAAWKTVASVKIRNDVYWSDHFPLEIQCNLDMIMCRKITAPDNIVFNKIKWGERDSSQTDVFKNICHENLRDIHFPLELGECCDTLCNKVGHRYTIDTLYMSIINVMCEAAVCSYDGRDNRVANKGRGRVVPGWNLHVREAHRNARQKFLCWISYGRPRDGPIYREMVDSRKIFKSKLRFCQNNQEQIKMDILATKHKQKDFRGFWKTTKQLSPKPGYPVSVDGVYESKEIANRFMEHFKAQSYVCSDSVSDICDNGGTVEAGVSLEVPARVTAKEISNIIKSMTRGRSPGHDSLSIEHLQNAGPHLPRLLALLFTLCIRHAYLPDALMKTVVVPILKNKTGDPSDKANYRPISLATITAKVLDAVLERQLSKQITISDAQFGFKPKLSTECAILSLKHTVRYYTHRKTPVYAAFLDLSRAFDLVRYKILWRKLRKAGVPEPLISTFKYWYKEQTNQVRWGKELSEVYRLDCGVRQGGLTSPSMFNLYMNDLIEGLSSAGVGCSIDGVVINSISYADDMVLLGPSVSALRRLLSICEAYAEAHGLRYNVSKSELLIFKARQAKPLHNVPPVTINGIALNRVTKFKYLGHVLNEDLRDDDDVERERRALAVRCNMLVRRFARCTVEVKIALFKAFCQSLYTCALWVAYSGRAVDALRVQYNNAFRMLLALPRYCSASGMFADARTDDFPSIIRKRTASLMCRIRGSDNSILRAICGQTDGAIAAHWEHVHMYVPSAPVPWRRYAK